MKSKNIIMHFKGQEEFVSRMLDLLDKAERYRKVFFTPFLNAYELEILKKLPHTCFIYEDGGYEKAERKRVALSYYEEEIEIPVICLCASFDEKYNKISHRDVLGALMNMGIEREVIGDILVSEGMIYLIIAKEMAEYVMYSLSQIKRCTVHFKECEEIISIEEKMEYTETTISSFRLDVLVGIMAHISREKAQMLIRAGKVKVNQVVLEESNFLCHNNSTVSIQRYGRFCVEDTNRVSRKGRHIVRIGKYV